LNKSWQNAPREHIEGVKPGRRFDRVNVIGALCNGNHYGIECYNQSTDGEFKGFTAIMDNAKFHRKSYYANWQEGRCDHYFCLPILLTRIR
jgi:hypothetical protein